MAGKGGGSVPQVNPQQLIQQQTEANRFNQYGPSGNMIWGEVGGNGQFNPNTGQAAAQVQESPFQSWYRQGGEDIAGSLLSQAAPRIQNLPLGPIDTTQLPGLMGNIDWNKIGGVPTSDKFQDMANQLTDSTFNAGYQRLLPEIQRQEGRLTQQLANKGLPMGQEAWGDAWNWQDRSTNEAISKLALDSVGAGRQEQSRLFGLDLTGRNQQLQDQLTGIGTSNTARAQGLQEQQGLRSQELGELASMLGLQGVSPVGFQSFFSPSNIDVTGPYQLSQNAALANNQLAQQNQMGMMSGLFGLGSAALGIPGLF